MTGSNRRPPPCKGDALPTELITPAVWSRIIGNHSDESTLFPHKTCVRRKNSHRALISAKNRELPGKRHVNSGQQTGIAVEDSHAGVRM
ncbi:hypothetical protein LA637_2263 [Erwinia amylovora LA637]|nr:hypothetical protein LA636_2260 [Erwinia amylovora LA636]CDK22623.1 hypothetical protein LA637_2263 [Erwinia amylovora LA637]